MKKKRNLTDLIKNTLYNVFFGGKGYSTEYEKGTPFPIGAVFSAVIITVLVLALIFSFIEISALSSDIADMKKEAVLLSSREGKLRDDLNHKYPHAALMEAIEEMGFTEDGGQTVIAEQEQTDRDSDPAS